MPSSIAPLYEPAVQCLCSCRGDRHQVQPPEAQTHPGPSSRRPWRPSPSTGEKCRHAWRRAESLPELYLKSKVKQKHCIMVTQLIQYRQVILERKCLHFLRLQNCFYRARENALCCLRIFCSPLHWQCGGIPYPRWHGQVVHVEKLASSAWVRSGVQEMDKKDTMVFNDQTVEFPPAEWHSFAGMDGFYFTVIAGANFGRVFLLAKTETVLGRSDEADIQIDDEKVSRKHLKISLVKSGEQKKEPTRVMVADLHSKNGIFINGVRVHEQELTNGDKLKIGETILKFEAKDRLDVDYHDKLYQQAICDPLTGLANRNYFQNELSKCISLSLRHQRTFAVMMLDIDFFKKVNDTYGHDVGDNVLKMVANMLLDNVRDHDVAARFGGEEFVLLLPETSLDDALGIAERIRIAVEGFNFAPLGCQHGVTISIGIGEFPPTGMETDELVKRTDAALYEAKTSGRNRVCIARPVQAS